MHEAVADEFFPLYKARCAEDGVVTKGDAAAVKALGGEPCTDWAVEYSDKIISVKVRPCLCFCACMHAYCICVCCFSVQLSCVCVCVCACVLRCVVCMYACVRACTMTACCVAACLFNFAMEPSVFVFLTCDAAKSDMTPRSAHRSSRTWPRRWHTSTRTGRATLIA